MKVLWWAGRPESRLHDVPGLLVAHRCCEPSCDLVAYVHSACQLRPFKTTLIPKDAYSAIPKPLGLAEELCGVSAVCTPFRKCRALGDRSNVQDVTVSPCTSLDTCCTSLKVIWPVLAVWPPCSSSPQVRLPATRTGPCTAPRGTPWLRRKPKQIHCVTNKKFKSSAQRLSELGLPRSCRLRYIFLAGPVTLYRSPVGAVLSLTVARGHVKDTVAQVRIARNNSFSVELQLASASRCQATHGCAGERSIRWAAFAIFSRP